MRLVLSLLLALAAQSLGALQPLDSVPSRWARLDGARVHYKAAGAGPVVVLVHGFSCDLSFWRAQTAELSVRARVIALDLPGHGRSAAPRVAYSMPLMARALLAMLDQEHVPRAAFVGHSLGALVVRHVLELAPERVQSLVTVDGALRPYFKTRADGERFRAPFRADFAAALSKAVDSMTKDMRPGGREWVRAAMLRTPAHVGLSALEHMHDPAAYPASRVNVPLGAIMAESPYWDGYEAYLRSLAAQVDYRVMKGVSHFLMIDAPGEFNAQLVALLEAQGVLAAPGK